MQVDGHGQLLLSRQQYFFVILQAFNALFKHICKLGLALFDGFSNAHAEFLEGGYVLLRLLDNLGLALIQLREMIE